MVLISTIKYACETCIKGHRSSTCKHTDRPLFEIKKKGRPVTQCEHCRELRKTKQVHVKCVCEVKEDSKKIASNGVPETAAYPNGLPQALEVSVSLQPLSEGLSSESDHVPNCSCKSGGSCNCCSPRKCAPRRRKKMTSDPRHDSDDNADHTYPPPKSTIIQIQKPSHIQSSSQVLARIAELRPVLPKPLVTGSSHDPSSSIPHGHAGRHYTHENMFFSPYGRAYEFAHGSVSDHELDNEDHCVASSNDIGPRLITSSNGESYQPMQESGSTIQPWMPSFPLLCGCGDTCSCLGCVEHPGAEAFGSCSNPGECTTCLDCTMSLSVPNSASTDNQTQYIDEWISSLSKAEPASSALDLSQSEIAALPGFAPWEFQIPTIVEADQMPIFNDCDCCCEPCTCPPGLCVCGDSSQRERCISTLSGALASLNTVPGGHVSCCPPTPATTPYFESLVDNLTSDIIPGGYLPVPKQPRARSSSSGSSQSNDQIMQALGLQSLGVDTVGFSDTQTRFFINELASTLNTKNSSPAHSVHSGDIAYAHSNPDSEGSFDERYSHYDPPLDGMRLY